MTKIIVLGGGDSDEREVSLRSAEAVRAALQQREDYDVTMIDYHADQTTDDQLRQADVIFPALHGKGGEDGEVQRRLEALGITYVGSDSQASALCMDKWLYKQHIRDRLPTPAAESVDAGSVWQSAIIQAPFVLKPIDGGSSVDTLMVRDVANIDRQTVEDLFQRHPQMLLEQLIEGIEITVAVLGNQALPVVEIIPPEGGEFDYTNKYNGATQELCPPQHLSHGVQIRAQGLAVQAHHLCGCRDMSRTDMFVTPAEDIYILETNTIPGLTDQSLLPREAAAASISMPELTHRLVQAALDRKPA